MPVNDVSLTTSLNVSKIYLQSEPPSYTDSMVPWRRRSRLRRILHNLRSIRRRLPNLLCYCRQDLIVYVIILDQRNHCIFTLMWPPTAPGWQIIYDPELQEFIEQQAH